MDDYQMNATLVQRVVYDENSASGFLGYKAGIDAGRKSKE